MKEMKQMVNNIEELNCAFQKYFRTSKRVRIHSRNGVFLIVDDKEQAIDLIRKLFMARREDRKIMSAKSVSEAQMKIKELNNGEDVKAVVIDIGLSGEGNDGNGVYLARWLNDKYPDIPFLFSTGKEKRAKSLEKEFPGVDIFIKGKDNIYDLSDALGLNVEGERDCDCIPKDEEEVDNKNSKKSGVFHFVRKILAL